MSWFSDGEKVNTWYLLHSGDADPEDFIPPYERVDHDYTAERIAEKVLITASWCGLENSLGIGCYDGWCHIDTRGYTARW